MSAPVFITASYAFVPISEAALPDLREELMAFGVQNAMKGLMLIATEGVNSTVSGTEETIVAWKKFLTGKFGAIVFKDSTSQKHPFRRWSVKIKPEIVGLRQQGIEPKGKHRHLTPEEWQETLEKEDVIVLDTRNTYETQIGKFKNAVDPRIKTFSQFPEFVKDAAIPKDKKVLMYCTGGIRCEKALLEMEKQGYENVYQLEGGILAYLEKFPQKNFEGECYVFDHRIAVDQHLQPSQTYGLCPHCGDPGTETIHCVCGKEQKICTNCMAQESKRFCSKKCISERRKVAVSSAA